MPPNACLLSLAAALSYVASSDARSLNSRPATKRSQSIERALADAPPTSVVTYDARYNYAPTVSAVAGYEEVTLIAALTGLANRDAPTALINIEQSDSEWLALMTAPGGWLAKTTLEPVAAPVENLVARLVGPAGVRGVVLFDPNVTCSSAVANTAAGAENLLPIAFRPADPTSLYSRLVAGGPRLPVVRSLVGLWNGNISGSVKRDCYEWAIDTFVLSEMTDASNLGYYIDYFWTKQPGNTEGGGGWAKATVPNIDFTIAHRGFAFDLCVWDDEAPVDEPAQPLGADLAAFRYILGAAYNQTKGGEIIRMHGFTPWAYKCVGSNSKHNHGGVDAEWATGKLISAYNTMDDGDACCIGNMANAAFYQHFPLLDRYVQPAPPSADALKARGLLAADGSVVGHRLYYMFYAGDYDSAAWISTQLLPSWNDPARGSVPIGWGLDPGLASRFPPIWPVVMSSLSAMDNVITGDSGAGYLNPSMLWGPQRLAESGLPDGLAPWIALNTALNRQYGIRFTGFSISGDSPQPTAFDDSIYANFSSFGVVNQGWPELKVYLNGNLPVLTQSDLDGKVSDSAGSIASYTHSNQASPAFHMFRSVLTNPTFLSAVAANATALTSGAAVAVTPLELSALMRVELGGSLNDFVAYVADNIPATAPAGSIVRFNATVRNDGWNTIGASNHGLVVTAASLQRLVAARARARAETAAAGLAALSTGVGATKAARRLLSRAGFVGRAVERLAGAGAVFPLPADIAVGGTVLVNAEVQMPALAADDAGGLVDIEYQLAELDANGNVVQTFDAKGNIAWSATVALV